MKKLLTVLLAFIVLPQFLRSQNIPIKNLVFEGGGVRGLAYAGALMELEELHVLDSVERVAGTSAGAIAATLYAVGYKPNEIDDLISELKINSFADGKWMFIGGTRRMIKNFGWYRGDRFNRWMSNLIQEKTGKANITFRELHQLSKSRKEIKELYLTGTNLTLQKTSILSFETFPEMEVHTGVRISMSIPFFFEAIVINKDGKICSNNKSYHKGYVMVDGGILANYPIHIFDYKKYVDNSNDSSMVVNYQTLGIRLDEENQIDYDRQNMGLCPCEITRMKDFTAAFYNVVHESLNRQSMTEQDWQRSISVSTGGIGARIRKMSQNEKQLLVENGRKGVKYYYARKSSSNINKP
jgi:NTE family protein